MPLSHALGLEMDIVEVKPSMTPPAGGTAVFVGSVDDEPLGVYIDEDSLAPLLETVVPGAGSSARRIVLEYLCRRLLGSLAISWSGPESTVVRFESEMSGDAVRPVGAVKLSINVNGIPATLWLGLGKLLLDRLDGLWRRQVQSTTRKEDAEVETAPVKIEVASLAVPPSKLSDYTRSGEVIDLETALSDHVALCSGSSHIVSARLCVVGDRFGVESLPTLDNRTVVPAGMTRLSFEFGEISLDEITTGEMAQDGSVTETNIRVGNRVRLAIDGQEVGQGVLHVFEGRFAVAVA